MNIRDIPVRVIGPGSQPGDGDAITYMDMPNDMSRFVAPIMPEPEDVLRMDGAREAMDWLRSGRICETKTVIGLFWLEKILHQGW